MSKDLILRTGLTGGASGDLDNYPVADCETGKPSIAFVQGDARYDHIYDESEAGAESSPDIIIPDDNSSGTGAWVLTKVYSDNLVTVGTFTPEYYAVDTDFDSVSYAVQVGRYHKIGTTVHFWIELKTSSITVGSAAGAVRVKGLPETSKSDTYTAVCIGYAKRFSTYHPSKAMVKPYSKEISLYYRATNPYGEDTNLLYGDLDTTTNDGNTLYISGTYESAS